MNEPDHKGAASLELAERALAQAGTQACEAVGLRPDQHFDGAAHPAGRVVRLSIRPGFDLSAFELDVVGKAAVSATTQPCLAIVVLLSGYGEGKITQEGADLSPTPYRPGHLYVSMAREPTTGRGTATGNERFRLVELRLSLDFIERIGMRALYDGFNEQHAFHHASGRGLWLGMVAAPLVVLEEAELLLRDALEATSADMRIEAAALKLFEAATEIMRSGDPRSAPEKILSREYRQLEAARNAMKGDLTRPWPIQDLARLIGLNTRKLKEGYRTRFGRPVHADLQIMRIEHGRLLLRQGWSVTETSLAVGYANPSHFARLFRRHFGMPPSAYR